MNTPDNSDIDITNFISPDGEIFMLKNYLAFMEIQRLANKPPSPVDLSRSTQTALNEFMNQKRRACN